MKRVWGRWSRIVVGGGTGSGVLGLRAEHAVEAGAVRGFDVAFEQGLEGNFDAVVGSFAVCSFQGG